MGLRFLSRVFLDRDGKLFGQILAFLRDGRLTRPSNSDEADALSAELRFFLLDKYARFTEGEESSEQGRLALEADMARDAAVAREAEVAREVAEARERRSAALTRGLASPSPPLVQYVATHSEARSVGKVVAGGIPLDVPGHFARVEARLVGCPGLRVVSTCSVPAPDGSWQLITTLASQ